MTLEFIIFAVLCFILIAKLLNDKWGLEEESKIHKRRYNNLYRTTDGIMNSLATAGKNYIDLRNKLNKLEIEIIDQHNALRKYQERDAKRIDKIKKK